jgi:hypothetical protein
MSMSIDTESRTQPGRMTAAWQRLRSRSPRSAPKDPPPSTPLPPRLPGRRNPKWIALGIVAICLGGLLSYVIYARVATETSVIALAHTVYRGQVVAATDLTTVTLSGEPGVSTVPAAARDSLIGQRAVYDLVAGSVLPDGAIAPIKVPQDKRALVGIKVAAGRAPSNHLPPGATVRLIAVPPPNAEPSFRDSYTGKAFPARVVDQQPGPDAASSLVNVDVGSDQAPAVALLASQDRLTIVRDADR